MKAFLAWLEVLTILLTAVLIVSYAVAYVTGDGLSGTEERILLYGLMVWVGVLGVGYILDPRIPMRKRRRR